MSYVIGGHTVNTRIDWRQQPTYGGTTQQRSETFPGSGSRHITIGEQLPAGVVITGFIEAANIAALKAALDAEAARMAETTPTTVALNGASYANQYLANFLPSGGVVPFNDGGTVKMMMKVRYTWVGVSA